MSSIYSIMGTAKWALLTHQRALQVTSHNVANVGTPGYSRQELVLEPVTPLSATPGQIGMGVRGEQVRRVYDRFVEFQLQSESQALGKWQAEQGVMGRVSAILNETSEVGLNKQMAEFWAAWQDVADNPSGLGERTNLMLKAQAMSQRFTQIHSGLANIQNEVDRSILDGVDTINTVSDQIAALNRKIAVVEAGGQHANDYRDQRDQLLKELSEWIDFTSFEQADGKVTVVAGGGKPIVLGDMSFALEGQTDASGFTDVMWNDGEGNLTSITSGIHEGKLGGWLEMRDNTIAQYLDQINALAGSMIREVNKLHASGVGLSYYDSLAASHAVDSDAVALASAASGLSFWDEIVEGGSFSLWTYDTASEAYASASIAIDPGDTLQDLQQKIDAVAGVSAAISDGRLTIAGDAGYQFFFSDDGSNALMALGLNTFFDGADASDIAVDAVVQNDVNTIAAAMDYSSLPGDNRNALAIADLPNQALMAGGASTFDGYYSALIGQVGNDASKAQGNVTFQEGVVDQLQTRREQISGVSLDEEMTNLIKFQHAYNASAQMIRMVDEMLETVVGLV